MSALMELSGLSLMTAKTCSSFSRLMKFPNQDLLASLGAGGGLGRSGYAGRAPSPPLGCGPACCPSQTLPWPRLPALTRHRDPDHPPPCPAPHPTALMLIAEPSASHLAPTAPACSGLGCAHRNPTRKERRVGVGCPVLEPTLTHPCSSVEATMFRGNSLSRNPAASWRKVPRPGLGGGQARDHPLSLGTVAPWPSAAPLPQPRSLCPALGPPFSAAGPCPTAHTSVGETPCRPHHPAPGAQPVRAPPSCGRGPGLAPDQENGEWGKETGVACDRSL